MPVVSLDVRFSNRPSGSSTFRLSTNSSAMSLTGSRFSSDSAPRPFHHGIRRRGGTIFWATLDLILHRSQARADLGPAKAPAGTIRDEVPFVLPRPFGLFTERGSLWICPESYNRRRAWLCNQVKVKQPSAGVIGQVFDSCSPHLDRGSHKCKSVQM